MTLAALHGCASIDIDRAAQRRASHAIPQDTPSRLQKLAHKPAAGKPKESSFVLLDAGLDALAARLWLAEKAEKTLDVQYYIFHGDKTGALVAEALMKAAERGVRVRILLDDIYTHKHEADIMALYSHPNIEIRLFNPFHFRGGSLLIQLGQYMRDDRLNRRMHNKLFAADNQFAITGGRNIGDEYFGADHEFAFVDLDVLAGGAIVDQLSTAFDRYWNNDAAVPARALPNGTGAVSLDEAIEALRRYRARLREHDYGRRLAAADPLPRLLSGSVPWRIAQADLIVDPPAKVLDPDQLTSTLMVGQLAGLWVDPARRALIVSPYFVPGPFGMAYFRYWRHLGVQIDVLTNAYAASDVPLVHAGYANYRVPLLEAGVNLYELKPLAEPTGGRLRDLGSGASRASLHAKTFVLDDAHVFIGSFNFDPRSALLNTEMGLVIHSRELAREVTALVEDAMRPERSYRPHLVTEVHGSTVDRRVVWHDVHRGRARETDVEPETTALGRGLLRMLQALPIEKHL